MSVLVKSVPFPGLTANFFAAGTAGAMFPVVRGAASPDLFVRAPAANFLAGNATSPLSSVRGNMTLNVMGPRDFEPRRKGQPPSKGTGAQGRRILDMLREGAQFSVVFQRLDDLGVRRIVLVSRYSPNFIESLTDGEIVESLMEDYHRIGDLGPNDEIITFDPEYMHSMRDKPLAIALEHELWHVHDTVEFSELYGKYLELVSRGAVAEAVLRSVLHFYLRVGAHRMGRASFASADIADQMKLGGLRMKQAAPPGKLDMFSSYIGDTLETSFAHATMGNRWRAHYCDWRLKAAYETWLPKFIDRNGFFGLGDRLLGLVANLITDSSGGLESDPPLAELIGIIENVVTDVSI